MSQSTPLNQLPNNQPQVSNDDDLVNDILNEMESNPEPNNDMNADTLSYAMDASQVPPVKMDQDFLGPEDNNPPPVSEPKPEVNNPPKKSMLGLNLNFGNKGGLMTRCVSSLKLTVVVLVLVLILSLPQVNRVIFTKIPSFLNESGEVNIKGVLLKSVVAAVLFFVASLFL